MTNRKGLMKLTVLLSAFLLAIAVTVIVLQYRQLEYIFRGESVSATVVSVSDKDQKRAVVSYIDENGDSVEAKATLKKQAAEGDKVNVIVSKRHPETVYQIPSRHMIMMFDIVFLFFEFCGWLIVIKLMRKLKKYKKLDKKGKKAIATVLSVKNTSGVLGADIEFVDDEGTKRKTVYYPESDIPEAGDKIDIVYYIKRTGKVVFMVPNEE